MDLYSLGKFKKYKNDWNYPVQVRYQEHIQDKRSSNFHTAMKVTIIVGQCFGLNPVLGVCEKDPAKLRFKATSWRCIYTYVTMALQSVMACLLVLSLFRNNVNSIDSGTDILFYFFGLITTALFLRIAMKWPELCMHISQMEAADPTTDSKLKIKFNISCFLLITLAIVEHLFSELHGIALAIDCEPENPIYESHVRRSFPWVFMFVPYNMFYGIMTQIVNMTCTFNWNFPDLFVICMSIYLTSRLEQVNHRVVAAKDKNSPPSFWRTMREDYNKATYLVRKVDRIIGGLIFISFASNLFFVCSQLLHTLAVGIRPSDRCNNATVPDQRYMRGYEHSIYFAYSFIFLVARSLAVSLAAARVNAASLEPAYALYDVSSATYCVEIERFLDQIHGSTVALSGLQFFNVKRGLILTIAGTIVTYELVLMQFTGVTPTTSSP
ncbi:gustatory receptor for sugar taste 64f-like [Anticarsia gemmatalis]|uniref:gustatory receptor for sugar taste 64f-like n=1 Tax=Anticarsia gemmatalis TaxID=129554 RepID=UPI003F768D1B